MRDYSKTTIIGRLGAEPDLKQTPNGDAVCNLRVAVGRGGEGDETDWFRVSVWRKSAENANKYLKKGSKVLCEGRLQSRKYQNKDGVEMIAWELNCFEILFMDPKPKDDDEDEPVRRPKSRSRDDDDDDDTPRRPAKKAARDDDDDDDEPKRPAKSRRRDEEEEEDDEPVAPRGSSRYKR